MPKTKYGHLIVTELKKEHRCPAGMGQINQRVKTEISTALRCIGRE